MSTDKNQRLEQLLQRSIPFLFWCQHEAPNEARRERCIELLRDIIDEVPRLGGTHIDGKVY